ncbi:MAG: type II toxin-antitoxin system VapC family toxin [Spirochaetales bacterium]|nr:type II toxin-antitoxin system VapC family toxin [Spirochaetales bacterium]
MNPIYLLDTCILSEPIKPNPVELVMKKLHKYEGLMAIPAIVWHELLYGVSRLPEGRRKRRLFAYVMDVVAPVFPVMPYDDHAAWIHASLRTQSESEGKTLSFADGQIASIALSNNMILVTRNEKDFTGISQLHLENWFELV